MESGKREIGESDAETLIREVKEEFSVDIISMHKLMGIPKEQ